MSKQANSKQRLTGEQRAEIYLDLAMKYDAAIVTKNYPMRWGVCVDLDEFSHYSWKDVFKEWSLFEEVNFLNPYWWKPFAPERVLALLFAHQIALNP